MSRFKFVHAADLHLDSGLTGLEEAAPEMARAVREATLGALERIVRLCVEEEASFLVLAGDVWDEADRSLVAANRLRDALAELARRGIPAFVASGNHDHEGGWRPRLEWPETVRFFPPGSPASYPVLREGRELARVWGIGYPRREVRENYARLLRRDRETPYAVAVLHANVGGQPGHDAYAPAGLEDLLAGGFDYWALGHVHNRLELRVTAPAIVYPGNTQGRNPRELGPRGCYLVEVEGRESRLRFVPTHGVEWRRLEVAIDGLEDEEALQRALLWAVEEAAAELAGEGRGLIALLRLTGRGPLDASLRRPGLAGELLEELRRRTGGRRPPVWIGRLERETRPPRPLEQLAEEPSFEGELARITREALAGGGVAERFRRALEPLYARGGLARHLAPPDERLAGEELQEALALLLDLLEEERARRAGG
ncbi:MAG: DNA repair exonuclease, partial [Clostridia bacterium]|nr:DNA repair exonuclease [Clostridia bacterium]